MSKEEKEKIPEEREERALDVLSKLSTLRMKLAGIHGELQGTVITILGLIRRYGEYREEFRRLISAYEEVENSIISLRETLIDVIKSIREELEYGIETLGEEAEMV